jgi:putative tryptophan/tyrosine transport system substrate-binding protein
MRRREFIALALGVASGRPFSADAQQRKVRVGIIDDAPIWNPLREQLRELNYVEGQNITFDYRVAQGIPDRLQAAAEELAHIPVDVIVVYGTPAAQAAKRATKTIPIVAISIGDPIGAGLITSLAHPGSNVTGNTILGPDVVTKRLQILKDAIPSASRIAFLWNPDNASNNRILEQLRQAAPIFQMTLLPVQAHAADDFAQVFSQMLSDHPDALLTTNDPLLQMHMRDVISFLLQHHIAGVFQIRQNVVDGGLMSYGASFTDLFRRGALYIDKILRGTKPEELPFEQPVTFELIVNLRTAKALGLELPATFLARADEVIE